MPIPVCGIYLRIIVPDNVTGSYNFVYKTQKFNRRIPQQFERYIGENVEETTTINVYCFRLSANVCRSVQKKNRTQSFRNENLKKVNLYRDVPDHRQYGSLTVNPSPPEEISASGCGLLVSYMWMREGTIIIIMNET